jgi:hypothetical protein
MESKKCNLCMSFIWHNTCQSDGYRIKSWGVLKGRDRLISRTMPFHMSDDWLTSISKQSTSWWQMGNKLSSCPATCKTDHPVTLMSLKAIAGVIPTPFHSTHRQLHDRPGADAPKLIARSPSLTCVHHKNNLQHATPLYCNKDVPLYRMKDTSVASRNT